MKIFIQFNKEQYEFSMSNLDNYTELLKFIQKTFKCKLPSNLQLYYKDQDNDNITISCDDDIQAMIEGAEGQNTTIYIENSDSVDIEKKEDIEENKGDEKGPDGIIQEANNNLQVNNNEIQKVDIVPPPQEDKANIVQQQMQNQDQPQGGEGDRQNNQQQQQAEDKKIEQNIQIQDLHSFIQQQDVLSRQNIEQIIQKDNNLLNQQSQQQNQEENKNTNAFQSNKVVQKQEESLNIVSQEQQNQAGQPIKENGYEKVDHNQPKQQDLFDLLDSQQQISNQQQQLSNSIEAQSKRQNEPEKNNQEQLIQNKQPNASENQMIIDNDMFNKLKAQIREELLQEFDQKIINSIPQIAQQVKAYLDEKKHVDEQQLQLKIPEVIQQKEQQQNQGQGDKIEFPDDQIWTKLEQLMQYYINKFRILWEKQDNMASGKDLLDEYQNIQQNLNTELATIKDKWKNYIKNKKKLNPLQRSKVAQGLEENKESHQVQDKEKNFENKILEQLVDDNMFYDQPSQDKKQTSIDYSKKFSKEVINKAQKIQEVVGGDYEQNLMFVSKRPNLSINDLIEAIFEQNSQKQK